MSDVCILEFLKLGFTKHFPNFIHRFLVTKISPCKISAGPQYTIGFIDECPHITVTMARFNVVYDVEGFVIKRQFHRIALNIIQILLRAIHLIAELYCCGRVIQTSQLCRCIRSGNPTGTSASARTYFQDLFTSEFNISDVHMVQLDKQPIRFIFGFQLRRIVIDKSVVHESKLTPSFGLGESLIPPTPHSVPYSTGENAEHCGKDAGGQPQAQTYTFHFTEQPMLSVRGVSGCSSASSAAMASINSWVVARPGSFGESSSRPRYVILP